MSVDGVNTAPKIQDYYANKKVFITGGTGFIGKVLIEKLLRSCRDIDKIYVLIRSKKNIPPNERLQTFKSHFIFDRLHLENPSALQKIICVEGDCMEKDLGISPENQEMLQGNINVVFHVAATVKFENPLSISGQLNIVATRDLLKICLKMKELSSIVYVSTSFVNSKDHRFVAMEEVKSNDFDLDHKQLLFYLDHSDKETIDGQLTKQLNTQPSIYVFTKQMAENVFKEYSKKLPIKIVRPSIVGASSQEPYAGFVDNYAGATGLILLIGTGKLRLMCSNGKRTTDIVPVDLSVNAIIAAGFMNSLDKELKVYNNTSGELNPFSTDQIVNEIKKVFKEYPSKLQITQPRCSYINNRAMFTIWFILTHLIPSFFCDLFAILLRKPRRKFELTGVSLFALKVCLVISYNTLHNLKFDSTNMAELAKFVQDTGNNEFNCDIKQIVWEDYMRSYIFGVKKHLLKDDNLEMIDEKSTEITIN